MTDAQQQMALLTLIVGALGGIIKWVVGQWREERKSDRDERKEDRTERKADRDAQTAATMEVAKALTAMSLKFDAFEKKLDAVEGTVEHVADEITGNHRLPQPRAQTAPLGGLHGPRRPRQDTP